MFCNTDVLRWSKGQSNTAIDLSETHVSMNGTNLRISPVSVEDRGEYKCIAENKYFTAQDISATLEVYSEYLPSLPPSLPPSFPLSCVYVYACVLHVSTCMHVRYIRVRVCMYSTCIYVFACTVHVRTCMYNVCTVCAYMCMHVCYMCLRVCTYGTYVFACIVHVCTCMHVAHMHTHVQYMHVHVCM